MLTVEKIGGTSMTRFKDVLNNIMLKGEPYNRIFVVSAYAGVTNWLLEDKKTGAPGVYAKFVEMRNYEKTLDELMGKLLSLNQSFTEIGIDLKACDDYITMRLQRTKELLNSMAEVLGSGYVNKNNILLAAREILASAGEAHSAFNSVNILQNNGVSATFVDLSGFHDSEFLTIDERIRKSMAPIDFSKTTTVVTGYTKGKEGIMRSFDRGYSEVTFSKIAVEVKADEAVIHKEYHLSSADPLVIGTDKAIPVGMTNYDVADQLADVGMEAIHPKAAKPLEKAGINLRIKNTFDPEHPGTLISKAYKGKDGRIEMIAGSESVAIIDIFDPIMVGEVGFDLGLMQVFEKHNVSYILKSTNANSISMIIWEKQCFPALIKELEERYHQITVKPVAIVCVLGSNISKPGVLAEAAKVLADNQVNIESVAQSLRQVNMQFVIERSDYNKAIRKLHQALCEA